MAEFDKILKLLLKLESIANLIHDFRGIGYLGMEEDLIIELVKVIDELKRGRK